MSRTLLLVLFAAVAVHARSRPFQLDNEFPLSGDVVDFSEWRRSHGSGKRSDEETQSPTVCETDECKFIAQIMKASINESVDPCVDFYQYACGMWPENNLFPDDQTVYSLWGYINTVVNNRTQEILSRDPSPDDTEAMKVARHIFTTCMDTDAIENEGLQPFLEKLAKAGGWPLIMKPDEWKEEDINWQKLDDYYARLLGTNALYTLSVGMNEEGITAEINLPKLPHDACKLVNEDPSKCPGFNQGENFVDLKKITKPKRKTSKNWTKNEGKRNMHKKRKGHTKKSSTKKIKERDESDLIRNKYISFLTEVALAFVEAEGNEVSRGNIEKDVQDLVDFMIVLQNIMDPPVLKTNSMSISELQELYDGQQPEEPNGNINWQEKASNLFDIADIEIESDFKVLVRVEDYLKNLAHLLNKTPKRVLVNYVHWNFVSNYLYASTRKMRVMSYNWDKKESEVQEETPEVLKNRCDNVVDKSDIIGYEYVKKYFSENVRKKAADMISHIQQAVREEVEKSEWLNDWAKNFSLDKLKDMEEVVGYPEYYNNKTYMDNYYNGMTVGPSFFENCLSYNRYNVQKVLRYLHKYNPQSLINPLTLNAFYAGQVNAIAVSAADLENPLFGASRPATLNYGMIGAVLGHEINHGFDDSGRRFDHKGKLTQWVPVMLQEYNKRADCFDKQFENYANELAPDGSFKGYGNQTKDENIADTMGLEACYSALKITEKERGRPEATLPGFENFTTDQMFFLAYANVWCASTKENGLPAEARSEEHSVAPLRVRGSVSNAKAFGQAFNCAVGTPMNPRRKCNIWH